MGIGMTAIVIKGKMDTTGSDESYFTVIFSGFILLNTYSRPSNEASDARDHASPFQA
jgi:hypothetical protein